jgi:hypothetical protein
MSQYVTGAALTRAEAAYAHLAAFQRGDMVSVIGRRLFMPGTVIVPQQDGCALEDAYVIVTGTPATNGAQTVRVSDMLSGDMTITRWTELVQHFDEASYAAQNPEG